jgi:hypothetical protein
LITWVLYVGVILFLFVISHDKSTISLPRPVEKRTYSAKRYARLALFITALGGLCFIGINLWFDLAGGFGVFEGSCYSESPLPLLRSFLAPQQDDAQQIRTLMDTEASATLSRDVNKAVGIFAKTAIIRDAVGSDWSGCGAIRDRYNRFFDNFLFSIVQHRLVELNVNGDQANAKTILRVEYGYAPGMSFYTSGMRNSIAVGDSTVEEWNFVKISNMWKVETFIYGLDNGTSPP